MSRDDTKRVPSEHPFFRGGAPQIDPIWINWFQNIKNRVDWINQGELDTDTPTHVSTILTGLTASRPVASDANKKLVSADLASWIAGTTNQVTVTDDGDGSVTLSTPQDIHSGASPTFAGLTITSIITASGSVLTLSDSVNMAFNTGTGTKIGTATGQKLSFWNATPVAQQSHIADASTGHTVTDPGDAPADADALRDDLVANAIPDIEAALDALGTKVNEIITLVETLGLTATA